MTKKVIEGFPQSVSLLHSLMQKSVVSVSWHHIVLTSVKRLRWPISVCGRKDSPVLILAASISPIRGPQDADADSMY